MNNFAQNNLTLAISKNDLADAMSWLTFGRGPTEWGNRRSGLTQGTEGGLTLCVRTPLRVGRVEAATNAMGRCARRHRRIGTVSSAGSDPGARLRIPF